jgi:phosphohistidine swiveling domain-containing protein
MAPLLEGAAAIVAEHGGLLGHGAALAREMGIPCVVGCIGAMTLTEGEEVWVDADAGVVVEIRKKVSV